MNVREIQNILVPVDFSSVSMRAMHAGSMLCSRYHARLTLLHVVEASRFLMPGPANAARLVQEWADVATQNLSKQAQQLSSHYHIPVDVAVQCGEAGQEINRCIEVKAIDSVILGISDTNTRDTTAHLATRISSGTACPVHMVSAERTSCSNQVHLIRQKIRIHETKKSAK